MLCGSRKHPYLHPRRISRNSRGKGDLKNLEFPEGWGFKPTTLLWEEYGSLMFPAGGYLVFTGRQNNLI